MVDTKKIDRFVDIALKYSLKLTRNNKRDYYGFKDEVYMPNIVSITDSMYDDDNGDVNASLIKDIADDISEVAILESIKNNKHFKTQIDTMTNQMVMNLAQSIPQLMKDIKYNEVCEEKERIRNNKIMEKHRVREEKFAAEQKLFEAKNQERKTQEKKKKDALKREQQAALKLLTTKQRKAISKYLKK